MPEIDDDDIAGKSTERRANRSQTVADLQTVGAAQPWDYSQPRPVGHRNRLSRQNIRRHGSIAKAVGKATIVKPEIEEVRDGAPLHVAIDEQHRTACGERPGQAGRP